MGAEALLVMSVTPDTPAAIRFLERWQPDGPWVLTAITPDPPNRRRIDTRTFDNLHECQQWIDEYQGQRNIYFMVNPATRKLGKKAEREDVAALAWLHVDIDPRAGEDLDSEQNRALALLQNPAANIPPPTVIVFSGGGYQGFWKLRTPLAIDGNLAKAEDAKRFNIALELAFDGDHCHNVDRIMRLPGTVNIPDEKKRAKGRAPALAALIEFHEGRVYDLNQFTAAPETKPSGAVAEVAIGAPVRVADLTELDRWGVPDRVKAIIARGDNREAEGAKDGDDSRSAWLYDGVCQLVRCGVPEETILGMLLDSDYGVSASVLDWGSRAERYARKQLASARADVAEDAVTSPTDDQRSDTRLLRLTGTGLTDSGNAERFARDQRGRVSYVRGFKSWLAWDGRRWSFDHDGLAPLLLAKETARQMERDVLAIDDADERKRAYRWAVDSHQASRRRAMVDLARPLLAVEPKDLDADPLLINVANGILDLRTYELRSHDPAGFLTKVAAADYEADARCAVWEAAIARVLPDPEVRACFQRALGYSLQGGQEAKQVFFLIGDHDSGKSTMIDAPTRALGFDSGGVGAVCRSYVAPSDLKAFVAVAGNRPELAYLFGARLVVIHEMMKGKELETGTFKSWSGGDLISATPKYGHPISFHPDGTLFFLGNEMARLDFADDAAWERVVVVPFRVVIPEAERDRGLRDRFDLRGVLSWLVEGHRAYSERGIDPPAECRAARERQRAEADPLHEFWGTATEPAERAYLASAELFSAYCRWGAEEREHERDRLSRRAFTEKAKLGAMARGYEWEGRGWRGVRLRAAPDEAF